jgi:hypothetical protein
MFLYSVFEGMEFVSALRRCHDYGMGTVRSGKREEIVIRQL